MISPLYKGVKETAEKLFVRLISGDLILDDSYCSIKNIPEGHIQKTASIAIEASRIFHGIYHDVSTEELKRQSGATIKNED